MIAITMSTAEMVGAGLWTGGGVIALALFIAIGDRLGLGSMLMDRKVEQQDRPDLRMSEADRRISIWDANDYFTATGAMRLRLHEYRRQLAEQKKAAATFERPAA